MTSAIDQPSGVSHRAWVKDRLLQLVSEIDAVASCDMPTSLRDLADEIEKNVTA